MGEKLWYEEVLKNLWATDGTNGVVKKAADLYAEGYEPKDSTFKSEKLKVFLKKHGAADEWAETGSISDVNYVANSYAKSDVALTTKFFEQAAKAAEKAPLWLDSDSGPATEAVPLPTELMKKDPTKPATVTKSVNKSWKTYLDEISKATLEKQATAKLAKPVEEDEVWKVSKKYYGPSNEPGPVTFSAKWDCVMLRWDVKANEPLTQERAEKLAEVLNSFEFEV